MWNLYKPGDILFHKISKLSKEIFNSMMGCSDISPGTRNSWWSLLDAGQG